MRLRRFVTLGLILGLALAVYGGLMDSAMGEARYSVSTEGVIKDNKTGLEWAVGPDKGVNYNQADAWVKGLKIDGSGWRMPTVEELSGLYVKGLGQRNMDPAFKTTGWFVWAKAKDSSSAGGFHFGFGGEYFDGSYGGAGGWGTRANRSDGSRVFGVRSLSRK
jgi:hypothetical protein